MKKIALLCDYGLDDAIATVYLLRHGNRFEKIDILPVAGNFPVSVTLENCKRLLYAREALPENLRIVDTTALIQPTENIPEIHGKDGMGDILPEGYEEKVSVISYDEWLNEVDADYAVISLGPCTVTEDIIRKREVGSIILMAGNIGEAPNYMGYEFNHGLNKAAFSYVVGHPHMAATLDTCHTEMCDLNRFSFSEEGLFGQLLKRYKELSAERGEEVCGIYDLVAVSCLLHPDRFVTEEKRDKDGNRVTVLKYISDIPVIEG